MPWSEVLFTLGLSAIFGLPLLGFTLYWTAEFLGLKVKERNRRLSVAEAKELRAQIARLQASLEALRGNESRLEHVEERLAFLERLLEERSPVSQLPPGTPRPQAEE